MSMIILKATNLLAFKTVAFASLSGATKPANIIVLKDSNLSSFLNGGFSWKEG